MAGNETGGELQTAVEQQLEQLLQAQLQHLRQSLQSFAQKAGKQIRSALSQAFCVDSVSQLRRSAQLYGEALAASLYSLRRELDGLQNALIRAVAPLASLLVPVARQAVAVLTALAGSIAQVLGALLGLTQQSGQLEHNLQGVVSAGKSLRRSLAGFDQLERLQDHTSSSSASVQLPQLELSRQSQELIQWVQELLQPLTKLDLSPLHQSLQKLAQALEPLKRSLFSGLQWAWDNLFVPMAQWTAEKLLPEFLQTLAQVLQSLDRIVTQLRPVLSWLWEGFLKPMANYAAQTLLTSLTHLRTRLEELGDTVFGIREPTEGFVQTVDSAGSRLGVLNARMEDLRRVGANAQVVTEALRASTQALPGPLGAASTALGSVGNMLQGISQGMSGAQQSSALLWSALQSDWGGAWGWLKGILMDPMSSGVRKTLNDIIRFINGVVRAAGEAVNAVIRMLNQLSFEVPYWVPVLGGSEFGFALEQIQVPQIPYLARGAVLPANKPFMAVLGDQRHGTNIEAPLSTIQEAVSAVMGAYAAQDSAGHAATVARLDKILEAVLGIELGDATIAAAVHRYDQKLAVARGG